MNRPYILCVDDDKSILLSLKVQLQHYLGTDYRYEVAESADEAWEVINDIYASQGSITLIISDYIMPQIKGDEFLISVHKKYPEIIKIMLTGHADELAIVRAKEQARIEACIGKPWNIEDILCSLKNGLEKQQ